MSYTIIHDVMQLLFFPLYIEFQTGVTIFLIKKSKITTKMNNEEKIFTPDVNIKISNYIHCNIGYKHKSVCFKVKLKVTINPKFFELKYALEQALYTPRTYNCI